MKAECGMCGLWVEEGIILHLRDAHGVGEPFDTWPDGSPVIVDKTDTTAAELQAMWSADPGTD